MQQSRKEREEKFRMKSPQTIKNANYLISKSQMYLKNNFYREFLPLVQDMLRIPYNQQVVKMLDYYELNEVAWKEKRNKFLFKENDFSKDTQKDHNLVRDNLYLQHTTMSQILQQDQVEHLMFSLGFLVKKSKTSARKSQSGDSIKGNNSVTVSPNALSTEMRQKIEFLKFWKHLKKAQRVVIKEQEKQMKAVQMAKTESPEKRNQIKLKNDNSDKKSFSFGTFGRLKSESRNATEREDALKHLESPLKVSDSFGSARRASRNPSLIRTPEHYMRSDKSKNSNKDIEALFEGLEAQKQKELQKRSRNRVCETHTMTRSDKDSKNSLSKYLKKRMTIDHSDLVQDINQSSLTGDSKKLSKSRRSNQNVELSNHLLSDPDLILNDKVEVKVLLNALFDLMNMQFSNNHKKLLNQFPLLCQNRKQLEIDRQESKKKKPIQMVKSIFKSRNTTVPKLKKFPSATSQKCNNKSQSLSLVRNKKGSKFFASTTAGKKAKSHSRKRSTSQTKTSRPQLDPNKCTLTPSSNVSSIVISVSQPTPKAKKKKLKIKTLKTSLDRTQRPRETPSSKQNKTVKNNVQVQEFSFDDVNRQSVDIRNLVISKQRTRSAQLKIDDNTQSHPQIFIENIPQSPPQDSGSHNISNNYNTGKTLKLILSNSNSDDKEPNIYNFSPVASKGRELSKKKLLILNTMTHQRESGEFNLTLNGQSSIDANKYQSMQTCFKNSLGDEDKERNGGSPLGQTDHEEQQYSFGQSFQPTPKNTVLHLNIESHQAVNDTDHVGHSYQDEMTFDFSGTTLFKPQSIASNTSGEKETRIQTFTPKESINDQQHQITEKDVPNPEEHEDEHLITQVLVTARDLIEENTPYQLIDTPTNQNIEQEHFLAPEKKRNRPSDHMTILQNLTPEDSPLMPMYQIDQSNISMIKPINITFNHGMNMPGRFESKSNSIKTQSSRKLKAANKVHNKSVIANGPKLSHRPDNIDKLMTALTTKQLPAGSSKIQSKIKLHHYKNIYAQTPFEGSKKRQGSSYQKKQSKSRYGRSAKDDRKQDQIKVQEPKLIKPNSRSESLDMNELAKIQKQQSNYEVLFGHLDDEDDQVLVDQDISHEHAIKTVSYSQKNIKEKQLKHNHNLKHNNSIEARLRDSLGTSAQMRPILEKNRNSDHFVDKDKQGHTRNIGLISKSQKNSSVRVAQRKSNASQIQHPRWKIVTKQNADIDEKKTEEVASRSIPLKAKRFIHSKNEPVKALHLDIVKSIEHRPTQTQDAEVANETMGAMKKKHATKIDFGVNSRNHSAKIRSQSNKNQVCSSLIARKAKKSKTHFQGNKKRSTTNKSKVGHKQDYSGFSFLQDQLNVQNNNSTLNMDNSNMYNEALEAYHVTSIQELDNRMGHRPSHWQSHNNGVLNNASGVHSLGDDGTFENQQNSSNDRILNLSLPQKKSKNIIVVSDSKVSRPSEHSAFVEEVSKVSKNIIQSKQRLFQILNNTTEKQARQMTPVKPFEIQSPGKDYFHNPKSSVFTPKFTLQKRKSHTRQNSALKGKPAGANMNISMTGVFNIFQESDDTNTDPNFTPVKTSPKELPCSPVTAQSPPADQSLLQTIVQIDQMMPNAQLPSQYVPSTPPSEIVQTPPEMMAQALTHMISQTPPVPPIESGHGVIEARRMSGNVGTVQSAEGYRRSGCQRRQPKQRSSSGGEESKRAGQGVNASAIGPGGTQVLESGQGAVADQLDLSNQIMETPANYDAEQLREADPLNLQFYPSSDLQISESQGPRVVAQEDVPDDAHSLDASDVLELNRPRVMHTEQISIGPDLALDFASNDDDQQSPSFNLYQEMMTQQSQYDHDMFDMRPVASTPGRDPQAQFADLQLTQQHRSEVSKPEPAVKRVRKSSKIIKKRKSKLIQLKKCQSECTRPPGDAKTPQVLLTPPFSLQHSEGQNRQKIALQGQQLNQDAPSRNQQNQIFEYQPASIPTGTKGRQIFNSTSKVKKTFTEDRQDLLVADSISHQLRAPKNRQQAQIATSNCIKHLIKFEIRINDEYGTQTLEIFDPNNIEANVRRFALKYGITGEEQIAKLMRVVKKQYNKMEGVQKPRDS